MPTQAKIVAKGREIIANRIKGQGAEPKYLHWGGDGGTLLPLADTNTALGSPRFEARVEGAGAITTTHTANDTYRVVGTLIAESAATIREIGLFDAVIGGNLFVRGVFDALSLDEGDSIQFSINVVIKAPA